MGKGMSGIVNFGCVIAGCLLLGNALGWQVGLGAGLVAFGSIHRRAFMNDEPASQDTKGGE